MEPKQKQYPVVNGTGDRSKVWCCKEQYSIGTWNVRYINQGKLEVIKQEMATPSSKNTRKDYTWTSLDGQHWNQTDYMLCSQRWRSSIQSAETRPGADCGSDYELLIAKFRLKLKKVGRTTRPFRYDLNQIPYDYTVEVRNRFKGLDLIDRVPDELWTEVCDIVQETGIKTIPKKKKCKKAKWLSEEALQITVKRRKEKSKGEKESYNHLNAEFQRIARRDKKAFFNEQCKETGKEQKGKD